MQTKFFRILGLVAMLSTTIGPSAAMAQSVPGVSQQVPTSATVAPAGAGVAPVIECKWELPDMRPGFSDSTYPDGNIQYRTATDPRQRDDDKVAKLTGPCALAPIDPATNPAGTPRMAQDVHKMIQVRPNVHDEAPVGTKELRKIQLWAAVDPPTDGSGVSDVFWDVFHPDGTAKLQRHGIRVPVAECGLLGDGLDVTANNMFAAAIDSGQVAQSAVTDPNRGLLDKCVQNEKYIYYEWFPLSKHQPCGEYSVILHAISGRQAESTLRNYFDVPCFFNLELDFNAVNYGQITPGFPKVLSGNLIWDNPPGGAVPPTIRNTGNSGMTISVNFTTMQSIGLPIPKIIDQFDACFAGSTYSSDGLTATAKPLYCVDPIAAGNATPLLSATAPAVPSNQTLCPNRNGKLDFSIHPASTLPAASYAGSVTVLGVASRLCLTDAGHVDTTTVTGADVAGYPGRPTGDGICRSPFTPAQCVPVPSV